MSAEAESENSNSVAFFVRLGESDWDDATAAWRCPALELPGSQVKEIYSDGNRIDDEKYRIIDSQTYIRWRAGKIHPKSVTALVVVNAETKDQIIEGKRRAERGKENAEKSEKRWRIFAIFVPIIVAIISGIFGYMANIGYEVKIYSIPLDFAQNFNAPELRINGVAKSLPYSSVTKTNIEAEINFGATIASLVKIKDEDEQKSNALKDVYVQNGGFVSMLSPALNAIDVNVKNSASAIINSCSGGSGGVTPDNGANTIRMLNEARSSISQIREQAARLAVTKK